MKLDDATTTRLIGKMHEWVAESQSTMQADEERAEMALADIYRLSGREPPEMTWAASPLDALMQAQGQAGSNIALDLYEMLRKLATKIVLEHGVDVAALACGKAGEELLAHSALVDWAIRAWSLQTPRRPGGQIVRLHDLIGERLNTLSTWNGWPGHAMNQFLRGALLPFSLYAVEALAYVLKIPEAWVLLPYAVLGRSAGFVLPLEGRAWICARPTIVHYDENGLLHAEGGPALAWEGEMKFHLWHDREVSEKVVAPLGRLHWSDIIREPFNAQQDIMLERYGLERFCRAAAKPLHRDETGVLWSTGSERFGNRITVVEVINGTPEPDGNFQHYWIRVPPGTRTARGAVAWSYGLPTGRYPGRDQNLRLCM